MFGVVSCARSARQRQVVAGPLAFVAQFLGCRPHERMEPVHGTRYTTERVTKQVVATHVGEFVQQDGATTSERPRLRLCGQYNSWREYAAGKRHLCHVALDQARRFIKPKAIGNLEQRVDPVGCSKRCGTTNDSPHGATRPRKRCCNREHDRCPNARKNRDAAHRFNTRAQMIVCCRLTVARH